MEEAIQDLKEEKKPKTEELIIEAKNFFNFYKKKIGESIKKGENTILLNFGDLSEYSNILSDNLLSDPEETLRIMELALEETGLINNPRIRLLDIPEAHGIKIRNIRSRNLNELLMIEGIVRQASDVRPQIVNAKFECPSCGTIISVLQMEKKFREPSRCSCGRKGGFKLISKEMVDTQRLVIEETPESLKGGEQPKRINVFLKEGLVEPKMEEKTTPGSKVRVIGVLKEVPVPLHSGGLSTRFDHAIEANNIIPLEETFEELNISEEDERQIIELSQDPEIFEKMASSICPSIYGHEEIKKAMVLMLFSGVKKTHADGSKTRGDIHVLLVGDPGVAKSVTLKFMSTISPKGRYVVGKSTSGAGLTATVVRDEFLRGWSLEAGAMVLSNLGLVCIDELEKMDPQDRSAMHEAMEQQCYLPNFKIMLSNGEYHEIGNLVDRLMEKNKNKIIKGKNCEILPIENIELLSTDFSNHYPLKALNVSKHIAPDRFLRIILTNGREITVTPEHPCFITENSEIKTIPAKDLKKGMFFPVPSKIDIHESDYKTENDYLCKILGYYLSDGCYELNRNKKNGIQFWNNDKRLIEDFVNSCEKYFNKKPIISRRNHQFIARLISKKVIEEFNKLDNFILEKNNKRKIPGKIMKLPKENIRYLLRALYDGDGSVIFQKRGGCRISFVSQNKELEEQISDLLLRFGIQSSIFRDSHSNVWRLDISGQENLSIFLIEISFLSQHKKERLKSYHEKIKTYRTIKNLIPGCTEKISNIYKKYNISMNKNLGHSIDLNVEKQRKFLQKLVLIAERELKKKGRYSEEKDELLKIKKLAFGYANWIKIKEIKEVKNENIKYVYDISIEPSHSFISNGMILHNSVTISKANVQASLRAETTVLAAANPKFGRFDPYQSIAQQIDIPPTLINRFDVIFTLRDIPDKSKDEAIADHVLTEHQKEGKAMVIERELFRKYVAYAKQKVFPKLTDEAVSELKKFYVNLRNTIVTSETALRPIPISARQLEALIRLSEASAKIRLSNKVEKKDAQIAIELMKYYLMQVGYDYETKTFDIDKITTGIPTSQRSKIFTVRETILKLESKLGKLIPLEELENELEGKLDKNEIEDALNKLSISGDIFKPRRGYIQRM